MKVDELDKTIAVAAKDPALYGVNEVELDKRRRWTSTARAQVDSIKPRAIILQRDVDMLNLFPVSFDDGLNSMLPL